MSQGIVTIATGNIRYFEMANNLLYSIRLTNPNTKVAVITDKEGGRICKAFDDIVVLDKPYNSFLDKIELLRKAPYDENLFIDADSLVYKNLNDFWNLFSNGTPFSCFGQQLPIGGGGWFSCDDLGKYSDKIHYACNLHGGVYYIRKGEYCNRMYDICQDILTDYDKYKFMIFTKPADEPVIALASSVMNSKLYDRLNDICFYPMVKKVWPNIENNALSYVQDGERYEAYVLHFSNRNTERSLYRFEVDKIKYLYKKHKTDLISHKFKSLYFKLLFKEYFGSFGLAKSTIYDRSPKWIQNFYHNFLK